VTELIFGAALAGSRAGSLHAASRNAVQRQKLKRVMERYPLGKSVKQGASEALTRNVTISQQNFIMV
jgi:hypothetical protein